MPLQACRFVLRVPSFQIDVGDPAGYAYVDEAMINFHTPNEAPNPERWLGVVELSVGASSQALASMAMIKALRKIADELEAK